MVESPRDPAVKRQSGIAVLNLWNVRVCKSEESLKVFPDVKSGIGIVGGMGPYAGLDLAQKILDHTIAQTDQEHLPVVLISVPEKIEDRTEFLLGKVPGNPAHAISDVIGNLERTGASVVGMPCNTAHAPEIFEVIVADLAETGSSVNLVHMIREVALFIRERYRNVSTVGVLCTSGTNRSGVYPTCLEREGLDVILPAESLQKRIHEAIYDPRKGIKAQSNPVTGFATEVLVNGIERLEKEGAEAIVLGCTEMPLAITTRTMGNIPLIDPTLVLARSLIANIDPDRLKPYQE